MPPSLSHTDKPSLGAAMIVRNEADCITQAITSLKPFITQLVIVDTGSNDATPTICARLGAELHFYEWNDSFADARNYALGFLRTEWALALDADETLDNDAFPDALAQLQNPDVGGVTLEIRNIVGAAGQSLESRHRYTRLFRNEPGIRYSGSIHEQIAESIIHSGYRIADSSSVILHTGYHATNAEKIARNASLLRAELARNPNDAWLTYHLGLTEFAAQRRPEARRLLSEVCTAQTLTMAQRETAAIRLAQIALAEERWPDVMTHTNFSAADEQREGFRLYIRGVALLLTAQYAAALAMLSEPLVAASPLTPTDQLEASIAVCRSKLHSPPSS